jgi:general secretion pathway protein K
MTREHEMGSILVLVIWILLFLSIFSTALGFAVRQKLLLVGRLEERQKLRFVAEAGIQQAVSVLKADSDAYDAWSDSWFNDPLSFRNGHVGDGSFTISHEENGEIYYGLQDEESKMNLNSVTTPVILARLFQYGAGLSREDAYAIASSLLDWRDEDDYIRPGGAEDDYYQSLDPPYRPKNNDLGSLDELLWIKGINHSLLDKMLPYVTLHSSGTINLNTVSPVVLQSLGLGPRLTEKVHYFRLGPDGVRGTDDDLVFKSLTDAVMALDQIVHLDEFEKRSLKDYLESGVFLTQGMHFSVQILAQSEHGRGALLVSSVTTRAGALRSWREDFVAKPHQLEMAAETNEEDAPSS